MLTIKEYATRQNITVQAVYNMLKKYDSELKKHIKVKNGTKLLDEYAISFLEAHRKPQDHTVQVITDNTLQEQIQALQSRIIELQEGIIKLQDDNMLLVNQLSDSKHTLTDNENKHQIAMLEAQQQYQADIVQAIEKTRAEIEAQYQKTWFGLYKKV